MTQIRDLKEGTFVDEVLLTEKRVATAKNGKQYVDLVFSDKTGSLKCKKWDYQAADELGLITGKVYRLTAEVSTYQGELQGTIKSYLRTGRSPQDFVKTSRFNIDAMFEEVYIHALDMGEPLTAYVTRTLMKKLQDSIRRAPAAKAQHNAWAGGLIEHIWSMCQCAKALCCHYRNRYNQKISMDKVIYGVCAHDLGKTTEYTYDAAIGYSPKGLLTPHIVIGPCWVYEIANQWYKDGKVGATDMSDAEFEMERAHLIHIVASHHGSMEFGSPVVPATLEAILVHQIDMIDSKFMHALELVEGKEGPIPGFSEKSWSEKTSFMRYPE